MAAVIVTHHPEPGLERRITHLPRQVGGVVVVDNASTPSERGGIRAAALSVHGDVIENADNVGLATALNQGVAWAAERGYAWALTLDQDTVPGPELVAEAARVFDVFRPTSPAVIGARYQADRRAPKNRSSIGRVTTVVITAGALHSIQVWQTAGRFRDDFFIDSVDTEYCLRVRSLGCTVLIADRPTMRHSIGQPTRRRLGSRTFSTSNHSPSRRYYITRNRLTTWRMFARREPRYVRFEIQSTVIDLIKILLAEKDRRAKLAAVARGLRDGLRALGGRMTP